MTQRRTTRDSRDPRVPLHKPQFGDPAWARRCPKCELWYPWAAFHKKGASNRYGTTRASHYVRCLVCRTADGAVPKRTATSR